VYVIECEDKNIYIGETKRLYRRFNEHLTIYGSVNTTRHSPEKLVGLYKVKDNYSFLKYREQINKKKEYNKFTIEDWGNDDENGNLDVENHMTELYFYLRNNTNNSSFIYNDGEWKKIKGGKYTKELSINPILKLNVDDINDRPCCHCKYPCEVKISKDKKYIYYVCSLKNIWEDFSGSITTYYPCDFYKIYTEDAYIKKQYEINKSRLGEKWFQNIPRSLYKVNPESCIKCNKTDYFPVFAYGCVRRLCQTCLSNKYNELKSEYSIEKCLIIDDHIQPSEYIMPKCMIVDE